MRKRDAGAALVAYIAVRLAMNVRPSWKVNVNFAFYTEYASHYHYNIGGFSSSIPSELEVDVGRPIVVDTKGDGVTDTLIVPFAPLPSSSSPSDGKNHTTPAAGFRALDLTPLRKKGSGAVGGGDAFLPLFPGVSAEYIREGDANVVSTNTASSPPQAPVVVVKLASGYVDKGDVKRTLYVAAVWNDGSVSLHSSPTLDLVWRANESVFRGGAATDADGDSLADDQHRQSRRLKEFEEVAVILTPALGGNGTVIVGWSFRSTTGGDYRSPSHLVYYALDAKTGNLIWKHDGSTSQTAQKERETQRNEKASSQTSDEKKRPTDDLDKQKRSRIHRGRRTDPRRISLLRELSTFLPEAEECFRHFQSSIMDPANRAFPHFWRERDDTQLQLAHFERQRGNNAAEKQVIDSASKAKQNRRAEGDDKRHAGHHGQPRTSSASSKRSQDDHEGANVILSHGKRGIEVLSLRNGRPVCHLSLLEAQYYADVNRDGTLDHVQIMTNREAAPFGDDPKWIQELLSVDTSTDSQRASSSKDPRLPPCYVLVLSGMPARELLFNGPLCHENYGGYFLDPFDELAVSNEERKVMHHRRIHGAPPLLVEGAAVASGRSDDNTDIVLAVNAGIATKYGTNGLMQWQAGVGMPKWTEGSGDKAAFVGQIDVAGSAAVDPQNRPLLVSGEQDFVVLSPSNGKRLASMPFPQAAVARPILADVNGDGTTDVLIVSSDAVWGYTVSVRPGSTALLLLLGLILLGVFVALMINRFSQHSAGDRRSTDI